MLKWFKGLFGAKQLPADEYDVAIGVKSGNAFVTLNGMHVATLAADAVKTMGMAIDNQRAAVAARKPSGPDWPQTQIMDALDVPLDR